MNKTKQILLSLLFLTTFFGNANSQLKIGFKEECTEHNSILFGRILLDVYGDSVVRELIVSKKYQTLVVIVDTTGKVVRIHPTRSFSLDVSVIESRIINNPEFYICYDYDYSSDTVQIVKRIKEEIMREGEKSITLFFPVGSLLIKASLDRYNKDKLSTDEYIIRKLKENFSVKIYYTPKSNDSIKEPDTDSLSQKELQINSDKQTKSSKAFYKKYGIYLLLFAIVLPIGFMLYRRKKRK